MNKTPHLGNDIVDYQACQNKHLNQRFRQRMFTAIENQAIDNAKDKGLMLWALWAIKEAAFKAIQKSEPQIVYRTDMMNVDRENLYILHGMQEEAILDFNYEAIPVKLKLNRINEHVLHCLALTYGQFTDLDKIDWQAQQIDGAKDDASQRVRALALRLLTSDTSGHIYIERPVIQTTTAKRQGPPYFYKGGQALSVELSLSHDENYVAAAVCQPSADRQAVSALYDTRFKEP